jgi:hypothetical protein
MQCIVVHRCQSSESMQLMFHVVLVTLCAVVDNLIYVYVLVAKALRTLYLRALAAKSTFNTVTCITNRFS